MRTKLIYFIGYVLDEMSLALVWLLLMVPCFIIFAPIIFSLYKPEILYGIIFSVLVSMICSLLCTMKIRTSRKDRIFWDTAHDFQGDLNEAKTKQDIKSLKSKFDELKKLSLGGPHTYQLLQFDLIMYYKFELLPDSDTNSTKNQ